MGTAISVDLRSPWVDHAVLEEFFDWLRSVDERFSTYRDDSLVTLVRRGRMTVAEAEADPDFGDVMALCEQVRLASAGVFDAWSHDVEGLDPSGLVKGWSIDRGADILRRAGAQNFCINAGGDVLAVGEASGGLAWRIGIRHPLVADRVVKVANVRDLAVATSGAYERGAHIANPGAPAKAAELLSLTVVGPGLTLADAYATAAFAMGEAGVSWVASQSQYGVCAVTRHGRTLWDDRFAALLTAAEVPTSG